MKKLIFIMGILMAASTSQAQFPTTDSLVKFINKYIRNSAVEAFQNLRLNTALIGMTKFIDSAHGGQVKAFFITADTLKIVTLDNDTLKVKLTKTSVGLGNVDNTSDLNKPVSTAMQAALDDTAAAIREDIGSAGITTVGTFNSKPKDAKGAVIDGSSIFFQPVDATHAGMLSTGKDSISGGKSFLDATTNFQGYAPITTTIAQPSENAASNINTGIYSAFGNIGVFPSGKMFMTYREAADHFASKGVIKYRTSVDQGKTWSTATTIRSDATYDVREGQGGVTPSGRLVLFTSRFNHIADTSMDITYMYSDNEGLTWSNPQVIPTLTNRRFVTYGSLISSPTKDTVAMGWYGTSLALDTANVYIIKSGDNGATWGASKLVINDTAYGYNETSFIYLGGSSILGIARDENSDYYRQVLSTDNGNTWTDQGETRFDTVVAVPGLRGPAWLCSFTSPSGRRGIVCYYTNRQDKVIRAVYAYANELIANGISAWNTSSRVDVVVNTGTVAGYPAVVHPNGSQSGVGFGFDELSSTNTLLRFFTTPVDASVPIHTSYHANVGIGLTNPTHALDVASSAVLMGANFGGKTRTDATTKSIRFSMPHYTNIEEPASILIGSTTSTDNIVNIGFGSSTVNAATIVTIGTGATNTTVSGTEALRVTADRDIAIGTTDPGATRLFLTKTMTDQDRVFGLNATLPNGTTSSFNTLANFQGTTVNNTNNAYVQNTDMLAGATDPRGYAAGRFANATAGTGTSIIANFGGSGNAAVIGITSSTTVGHNLGGHFDARGGNISIGVQGTAVTAKNSATTIGVIGFGRNTGSSAVQIGGYFSTSAVEPTFGLSAALMADNSNVAVPIFVARDNGTEVFRIDNGGGIISPALTGYLKGNGASAFTASSTIPGSDISGNISGNAANVTGTVGIANGGLNLTSLGGANQQLRVNGAGTALEYFTPSAGSTASGRYTPTLTGVTNVASSTPESCHYKKNGDEVTVSGYISVLPTAGTALTEIAITLPGSYGSTFPSVFDAIGHGTVVRSTSNSNCFVQAETTGSANRAILSFMSVDTNGHSIYFSFTYQILVP